jgi:CobQ-like glutamine amidotransferase family enzyme
MIRLGTIAPERLNLNGDQGNLLALTRFLRLAGFEVAVVPVLNTEQALACNFVVLGHGSQAAMKSLEPVFNSIDFTTALQSVPGLAIGSGFEYLSELQAVPQTINRSERESEFSIGEMGPLKVLGYRNTDSGLPNLALNERWICSMLHGPLLAKNPQLLARAAKAAVAAAGLEWPQQPAQALNNWVAELNAICERIWSLECDEAYPQLML